VQTPSSATETFKWFPASALYASQSQRRSPHHQLLNAILTHSKIPTLTINHGRRHGRPYHAMDREAGGANERPLPQIRPGLFRRRGRNRPRHGRHYHQQRSHRGHEARAGHGRSEKSAPTAVDGHERTSYQDAFKPPAPDQGSGCHADEAPGCSSTSPVASPGTSPSEKVRQPGRRCHTSAMERGTLRRTCLSS
jgi:hypothetical protein